MKRILSFMLAAMICLTGFVLAPSKAHAESILDNIELEQKCFLFENSAPCFAYEKEGTVTNLKSSDESILTVELGTINDEPRHNYILTTTHGKTGTVEITFNFELNGVSKDYCIKLTFLEYKNAFKNFQVGNTIYTKRYTKSFYYEPKKMKKGKVNIQADEGWTLISLRVFDKAASTNTPIENHSNVKLKNSILFVTMRHESGIEQEFRLGSYRLEAIVKFSALPE